MQSACILLVHNHPKRGSDTKCRRYADNHCQDLSVQGKCWALHLLDHIIIGDQRYCSLQGKWNDGMNVQ